VSQHRNGRTQRRGPGAKADRTSTVQERLDGWRKLSPREQFQSLIVRRGNSKRQMEKLNHTPRVGA
jgi:hypothetical protein